VGIYGIVSYGVGRRTREIGVRMAVGAGRGEVFWAVMRGGLGQVLLGVVVGVAGAIVLGRLLAGLPGGLLYGVETTDPWLLVGVPAALVLVAVVASWVPARRAVAIDPVSALRAD
jgi:ABC-type antimicrobial peptide transport system permease subunit